MPSNSLTYRRTMLRRPIVCRKGPPSIPVTVEPPSDVTCSIVPQSPTTGPWTPVNVTFTACNNDFGMASDVAVTYSATAGTLTGPVPKVNCLTEGGSWSGSGTPGFYTLKAVFEWPDSTICVATAVVEVVGM